MAFFGLSFVILVLYTYVTYLYVLHQNESSRSLFWTYIILQLPFIVTNLLIVYHADKLADEVFHYSIAFNNIYLTNEFRFYLKGKAMAKIVHEIINRYDNENIVSEV